MFKYRENETEAQKLMRVLQRTPYEEVVKELHRIGTDQKGYWNLEETELWIYVFTEHGWTQGEVEDYEKKNKE